MIHSKDGRGTVPWEQCCHCIAFLALIYWSSHNGTMGNCPYQTTPEIQGDSLPSTREFGSGVFRRSDRGKRDKETRQEASMHHKTVQGLHPAASIGHPTSQTYDIHAVAKLSSARLVCTIAQVPPEQSKKLQEFLAPGQDWTTVIPGGPRRIQKPPMLLPWRASHKC